MLLRVLYQQTPTNPKNRLGTVEKICSLVTSLLWIKIESVVKYQQYFIDLLSINAPWHDKYDGYVK